ncbi:hypothetical protein [Spirillospora sp. CA-294931]|uniref:hypothetical protein n=1 Tax=Spirillospora sp. CA-294931 TaxID=3240042 RepID=UPI003D91C714
MTALNELQPGEWVQLDIHMARVSLITDDAVHFVRAGDDSEPPIVVRHCDVGVSITRLAPAQWPPQRDDIWQDRDQDRWFAQLVDTQHGDHHIVMVCGRAAKGVGLSHPYPDLINENFGPLRLVSRVEEGTTSGGGRQR